MIEIGILLLIWAGIGLLLVILGQKNIELYHENSRLKKEIAKRDITDSIADAVKEIFKIIIGGEKEK